MALASLKRFKLLGEHISLKRFIFKGNSTRTFVKGVFCQLSGTAAVRRRHATTARWRHASQQLSPIFPPTAHPELAMPECASQRLSPTPPHHQAPHLWTSNLQHRFYLEEASAAFPTFGFGSLDRTCTDTVSRSHSPYSMARAEMARANSRPVLAKVTCKHGSSERKRVQIWTKRTSKSLPGIRFNHFCTPKRSFEPETHVAFSKKASNSFKPFLHTTEVRDLASQLPVVVTKRSKRI